MVLLLFKMRFITQTGGYSIFVHKQNNERQIVTSYSTEEETGNSPLGQWEYFLMPIRGLDNLRIKSRLECDLLNPFRLVLGPNQLHVLGLSAFAKAHRLKK